MLSKTDAKLIVNIASTLRNLKIQDTKHKKAIRKLLIISNKLIKRL